MAELVMFSRDAPGSFVLGSQLRLGDRGVNDKQRCGVPSSSRSHNRMGGITLTTTSTVAGKQGKGCKSIENLAQIAIGWPSLQEGGWPACLSASEPDDGGQLVLWVSGSRSDFRGDALG